MVLKLERQQNGALAAIDVGKLVGHGEEVGAQERPTSLSANSPLTRPWHLAKND